MSANIVTVDEESLRKDIKNLVRKTVEETLNALLDEEASELVGAGRYERTAGREAYRSGHYTRRLVTGAGEVELNVPKLRGATFQTAVIERSWGGSYENVAVLVAIGVNSAGDREVIGCAEGYTESADSWREFFSWLKGRGLSGVRLVTGDKCAGMLGALEEVFPGARYQRCTVHFYRNVLGRVPVTRRKAAARMLKAIHAQESREACARKAEEVAEELESMRLGAAARTVRDGFAETLAYTDFPPEHWRRIRTNNGIERINREIRRRTRVVGTFPDGNSALMLVTARLKYIVEHEWGKRRYLDMSKLEEMDELRGKAEG